jgi:hypothetical protein
MQTDKAGNTWFTELKDVQDNSAAIAEYLADHRMENYGYDAVYWTNMVQHYSMMNEIIHSAEPDEWFGIYSRFYFNTS